MVKQGRPRHGQTINPGGNKKIKEVGQMINGKIQVNGLNLRLKVSGFQ